MSTKLYRKVYSHLYAGMAKALPPLVVLNTKKVCFAVPFPPEGFIERATVFQVPSAAGGGTATGFEVELLQSKIPFPAGSYALAAAAVDKLEPYRIQIPSSAVLTAVSGAVVTLDNTGYGFSYVNLDSTFTSADRFIYLLLKPLAAVDDTKWNVFLQARIKEG